MRPDAAGQSRRVNLQYSSQPFISNRPLFLSLTQISIVLLM